MKHNPEILAYCAGLLDADGSFSIHFKKNKDRPHGGHGFFQPKIQIKQVQREAIDVLKATFGGPRVKIVKPSCKGGRSLFYWYLGATQAANACRQLLPFLRLKKRQAEILIEMDDEITSSKYTYYEERTVNCRWGGTMVTKVATVSPQSIALRIRLLNESRRLNDTRQPPMKLPS